jgi:hypothetical protein
MHRSLETPLSTTHLICVTSNEHCALTPMSTCAKIPSMHTHSKHFFSRYTYILPHSQCKDAQPAAELACRVWSALNMRSPTLSLSDTAHTLVALHGSDLGASHLPPGVQYCELPVSGRQSGTHLRTAKQALDRLHQDAAGQSSVASQTCAQLLLSCFKYLPTTGVHMAQLRRGASTHY